MVDRPLPPAPADRPTLLAWLCRRFLDAEAFAGDDAPRERLPSADRDYQLRPSAGSLERWLDLNA
jgi:hypothetical protein